MVWSTRIFEKRLLHSLLRKHFLVIQKYIRHPHCICEALSKERKLCLAIGMGIRSEKRQLPHLSIWLMRIFILITAAFLLSTYFSVIVKADADDSRPLSKIDSRRVRLVEGQFYCYVGWGMQNTVFQFDGRSVYDKDRTSSYVPSFDLSRGSGLKFGCGQEGYTVGFFYIDEAFRFQNTIFVDNTRYNSIDYEQSAIVGGYSFPMVPHLLYIDAGLGYTHINYTLGWYGKGYSAEYSSGDLSTDSGLVYLDALIFVTHYFFVGYSWLQSIRSGGIFHSAGQLNFHFYRRF